MKNIKKSGILATFAMIALGAMAVEPSSVHVYVNPGHGGHDSDDRNVVIYPYTQGDPAGYWESNSNLEKGLHLRNLLKAKGCKVTMSRTTNTTADDLGLTTIGNLANASGADIFFSIHSNATGTGNRVNYPMTFYRGYTGQPQIAKSDVLASKLLNQLYTNEATVWTHDGKIYGDWTFYPSWGTSGLGVLRVTSIPAILSEGSFHDYIPETYRLMNKDFCWLEAWHFTHAVYDYFNLTADATGVVAGLVYDSRVERNESYIMFDRDNLLPVCGATVKLKNSDGTVLQTYKTDALYNGFFLFKNVSPGTYTIEVTEDGHLETTKTVAVTANKVAYANVAMNKVRDTPPAVTEYSPVWKAGDAPVLCNTPVKIAFNWDMDVASTEAAFKIEPTIKGEFTWEEANYALTFTPAEPYQANTLYTVTIAKTAKHGGGMAMTQDFKMQFTTDSRRYLSVTDFWPKDGSKVHYTTPVVELKTDSVVNYGHITQQIVVTDEAGTVMAFNSRNVKYAKSGTGYGYVRLTLVKSLEPGKTYTVKYNGDIADFDGLTLDKDYVCKFTAEDMATTKVENAELYQDFEDAACIAVDESGSKGYTSASVASSTTKLFGSKSVELKYAFAEKEGGEVFYKFAEPISASYTGLGEGALIGVFVNGDFSRNQLCAVVENKDGVINDVPMYRDYMENKTADCIDFQGWNNCKFYFQGSVKVLGFKIKQNSSEYGKTGSVKLDDMYLAEAMIGVEDVKVAGLQVGPNPASDYIVASADVLIEEMKLYSSEGVLVAHTDMNTINVSEIADGTYVLVVRAGGAKSTVKVVVKH